MRQFLLILFAGFPVLAFAQNSMVPTRGTSSDANAPVNVSVPALRPAAPAQHSSVQVHNPGRFFVNDDRPVTSSGDAIAAPNQNNTISKEEQIKQMQEMMRAEKAKNSPVADQKPGHENTSGASPSSGSNTNSK